MTIWDEWKAKQLQKNRKEAPPKAEKTAKEPIPKRQITADELHKLKRLQKVSTAWWCGDKRFITSS